MSLTVSATPDKTTPAPGDVVTIEVLVAGAAVPHSATAALDAFQLGVNGSATVTVSVDPGPVNFSWELSEGEITDNGDGSWAWQLPA